MPDAEQLAGYDDDGADLTPALLGLETLPSPPPASSPELRTPVAIAVVIGLGLSLVGVPSAAFWGVLAGLLRFVPYVGPLLAAVAPLTLAAAVDPGWWATIYVALLFGIIAPLTGYVVEPLLYGHSTGLSPMSVIVCYPPSRSSP